MQKVPGEKEKRAQCKDCKEFFPVNTQEEKKAFGAHRLTHVMCDCGIKFDSDVKYRAHMASAHLGKKRLK